MVGFLTAFVCYLFFPHYHLNVINMLCCRSVRDKPFRRFCKREKINVIRGVLIALFVLPFFPTLGVPADISGKVVVVGKKKLRDLVVYLEPAGGGAAPPKSTHEITQRDRVFLPGLIVSVAGDQVNFFNNEEKNIDHNVYSLSKTGPFDVGLLQKGESVMVSFKRPGRVRYFCSVHKNMEGSIVVVPSPHFRHLARAGPFTIKGVPAGRWVAKGGGPPPALPGQTRRPQSPSEKFMCLNIAFSA